ALYKDIESEHKEKHELTSSTRIPSKKTPIDLAIVATRSDVRASVIEKLLEKNDVKYLILEKVLFSKKEEYNRISTLLENNNVKTWVNCPRRIYPSYLDFKSKIKNAKKVEFSVAGVDWGMASNSIHFIDLFAFLLDVDEVTIDNCELENQDIDNNFILFFGSLAGTGNGHTISINCEDGDKTTVAVEIICDDIIYSIDETNNLLTITEGKNNWRSTETDFNVPVQSQLTHLVLDDLINNQTCGLTLLIYTWHFSTV
ncbi:MAG: hypothetical protein IH948_09110, partial [Bacteroidetes bacterium]|nr:hypothetical protein [Bacteroidota bacterium]